MKFVHCADVHLDSPMRGLARYEGAPVERLRGATRRAFERLVELALEEQAAFVIHDQHRFPLGRLAAPSGKTAGTSTARGSSGASRRRRGFGEDSIFLDAATGRWCAVISLGRKPDGRRDRRK